MFGEKADSGVEKEVRDLANKPGQQRAKPSSDFFEVARHSFFGSLQSFGNGTKTVPIVTPTARSIAVRGTPCFLKISLIFSRRGMASSLFAI